MSDTIEGIITKRFSDEIIEIYITKTGRDNFFNYLKKEKINLELGEMLDIPWVKSPNIKLSDGLALNDKIKCFVRSRDINGNIVAAIFRKKF